MVALSHGFKAYNSNRKDKWILFDNNCFWTNDTDLYAEGLKTMVFKDYFEEKTLGDNTKEYSCETWSPPEKAVGICSPYRVNEDNVDIVLLPEEGSFMWAAEQAKNHKKIRLKKWNKTYYIELSDYASLRTVNGSDYIPSIEDYFSTEWEIYEENQFGDYYVSSCGNLLKNGELFIQKETFDDLEKAIKRAREYKI